MKSRKNVEWALLTAGTVLLGFCVVAYSGGLLQSRMALNRFHNRLSHSEQDAGSSNLSNLDFTSWSEKRIRDYEASLAEKFAPPLAVLKIGRVRLEVPVFDGTDDSNLNRGAGRVIGTSRPGEKGNIAIAGHRDGFFRCLKDVAVGDELDLETSEGTWKYVIDSIQIVERDDLSVLQTGTTPSVTLVTCYPFYFIGSAPKRYIVHASLQEAHEAVSRSANVHTTAK